MARYDLTDFEWKTVSLCCRTSRAACHGSMTVGCSTAFSGSCDRARRGPICRSAMVRRPPSTDRFNRWRKAGIWDRLMDAVIAAHDGKVQMIDSTSVRVHQQAAALKKQAGGACIGRSRGGLTTNCARVVGNGLPVQLSSLRDKPTTPQWRSFCSTICRKALSSSPTARL